MPIASYRRGLGACAAAAVGPGLRPDRPPRIRGVATSGDFCSGMISSLKVDDSNAGRAFMIDSGLSISAFMLDSLAPVVPAPPRWVDMSGGAQMIDLQQRGPMACRNARN